MSTKLNVFSSPEYIFTCDEILLDDISDFEYITSKSELTVLQNDLCGNLKYPTTIIQRKNKKTTNTKETKETEDPSRCDSSIPSASLRPSCNNLRICASCELCNNCDSYHANLLLGEKELTKETIDQIIRKDDHFFSQYPYYNDGRKHVFSDVTTEGRAFLHYDCPYLGYREICFPIMCEKKCIGVLFVGQVRISGEEGFTRNQKNIFFNNNPHIFDEYVEATREDYIQKHGRVTKKKYIRKIKELIQNNDAKNPAYYELPKHYQSQPGMLDVEWPEKVSVKELIDLFDKIDGEVKKLEKALLEKLTKKRIDYINRITARITEKFYSQTSIVSEKEFSDIHTIRTFWNNVENCMLDLINYLSLRNVLVFGPGENYHNNDCVLKRQASSYTNMQFKDLDDLVYDMSELPEELRMQPNSSDHDERLFLGIPKHFIQSNSRDKKLLLVFPIPYNLGASTAVIIWYERNTETALETIEDKLSQTLLRLMTVIFSALAALVENFALKASRQEKQQTMDTLRILRHEITPHIYNLRFIRNMYLTPSPWISVDVNGLIAAGKDMNGFLRLLNHIINNIHIFTSNDIEIQKDEFSLYEILERWGSIKRDDLDKKKLILAMPSKESMSEDAQYCSSDKGLIEQVLYNVLVNAIKYCYCGTRITVAFKRPHLSGNITLFQITDYGRSIPDDFTPYDLYSRYSSDQATIEGHGIGLYVAKKAMEILRGDIRHDFPKEICKFNVPLMEAYLALPSEKTSLELKREITNELNRLKNEGIYYQIVSRNKLEGFLEEKVLSEIKWPTYEVTFKVEIRND